MKNAKKVFTRKKIKHGCKQSLRVQAHHKNRAYLDEDHIPAHKHSNCKGRERLIPMTNPPTKHIKPFKADASRRPDPKAEA